MRGSDRAPVVPRFAKLPVGQGSFASSASGGQSEAGRSPLPESGTGSFEAPPAQMGGALGFVIRCRASVYEAVPASHASEYVRRSSAMRFRSVGARAVVSETQNAKNAEPDPSAGPTPTATPSVPERVPPSPTRGRLRQHDPCPGPVGTAKRTGGLYGYLPVCKRTVTCQPPCGGAVGPLGDAVSGGHADRGTTPVLEHSEPMTRNTGDLHTVSVSTGEALHAREYSWSNAPGQGDGSGGKSSIDQIPFERASATRYDHSGLCSQVAGRGGDRYASRRHRGRRAFRKQDRRSSP